MPIAAVPNYLGNDFEEATPGLRFGLYLSIWTSRQDQEKEVRERAGAKSKEGEQIKQLLSANGMDQTIAALLDEQFCKREHLKSLPGIFTKNDFAAKKAWERLSKLNKQDIEQMHALLARQRAAFAARAGADDGLCIEAQAIAPFTTGLGNEHPLENGFAFLNPYGLPYLPGSGVKGVIRRAAQELAEGLWPEAKGWSLEQRYTLEVGSGKEKRAIALSMLDALFGRETPAGESDHVRGALSFWDVIPQIAGDSLMVEIMTPHQSHYYQAKKDFKTGNSTTPHECGQPTPISFLTVPPESLFVFHVTCDTAHLSRLAQDLVKPGTNGRPHWQSLIEAAFAHAFQWLGFGAKTAVGYGAMCVGAQPTQSPDSQQEQSGNSTPVHAPAAHPLTETWENATLEYKPNTGEVIAVFNQQRTAPLRAESWRAWLSEEQREKLRRKKSLKATVIVKRQSNLIEIVEIKTCG